MDESMSGPGPVGVDHEAPLVVRVRFDGPLHIVEMSGVLDLAGRATAISACTSSDRLDVRVDLSGLSFMDCAGYSALVASTAILRARGGSLEVLDPVGEVQMLLTLIEDLEPCPVRSDLPRFSHARPSAHERRGDARPGRATVSSAH